VTALLALCYPTYSRLLHLDAKGSSVVLAPDEMLRILTEMGHRVEVANCSPFQTSIPLMRSRLTMKTLDDVDPEDFDICWHMFRDPTEPEVMQGSRAFVNWFPRDRVVNHVRNLSRLYKRHYLPVFYRLGIGPRVLNVVAESLDWRPMDHGAAVSLCGRFIRTSDYNNNRGDYPEREARGDVVTEFLDGAEGGVRSFFRVGYAAGKVLPGWLYSSSDAQLIQKSGTCRQKEPHQLSVPYQAKVREAMTKLGIDAAHLEGTYVAGVPKIFDVNPYPTSYGATLASISRGMCEALAERWSLL
jgi:hypothetical protein